MTALDLEALEALERAATKGPWEGGQHASGDWLLRQFVTADPTPPWVVGGHTIGAIRAGARAGADAAFVEALRNSFPALAAELRAAREALRRLAEWPQSTPGHPSITSQDIPMREFASAALAAVSGARASLKDPASG